MGTLDGPWEVRAPFRVISRTHLVLNPAHLKLFQATFLLTPWKLSGSYQLPTLDMAKIPQLVPKLDLWDPKVRALFRHI